MNIVFKAVFDEKTREELRREILKEVRDMSEILIGDKLSEEIKYAGKIALANMTNTSFTTKMVKPMLKELLVEKVHENWQGIYKLIQEKVISCANAEIAKKMKDKVVFDAKGQDDYIRKVVRQELGKIFQQKD